MRNQSTINLKAMKGNFKGKENMNETNSKSKSCSKC